MVKKKRKGKIKLKPYQENLVKLIKDDVPALKKYSNKSVWMTILSLFLQIHFGLNRLKILKVIQEQGCDKERIRNIYNKHILSKDLTDFFEAIQSNPKEYGFPKGIKLVQLVKK